MELDPYAPSFQRDPYPVYAWLREHEPVHRNERLDFWALSRWADVLEAHADPGTYSSADGTALELMDGRTARAFPMIIFMDPPRQTRVRRLVGKGFTPRRIEALEPLVRELVVRHLERWLASPGRRGDLVGGFAALVPNEVISTMLGIPATDRPTLRAWIDASLVRRPQPPHVPGTAIEAGMELNRYFFGLLEERRRAPGDDLASLLAAAEVEGETGEPERLSDLEIVAFLNLLSAAGTETVTKALGNAAVLLARHPEQRARLVAEPAAIPAAFEEILRYWPPSQYQGRTLTRDVELHGVRVPAGARVLLLTGSACRDGREHREPDRFDVGRAIPLALSFGYGPHACLGASLARLEGRIVLEELLARAPGFTVDEDGLERVTMSNVHGFSRVPMRW